MKPQTQPSERKVNKASSLLAQDENERIFNILGRKCQSMCTAVAQVFKTEPTAYSHWKKKEIGVLCFVKDSVKRSYYMRMYCLFRNDLIWEHEMYDTIQITKSRPYLLMFEGEDGCVALNFASADECENFRRVASTTVDNRNKKRQERKNRMRTNNVPNIENENPQKVTLRNHPNVGSVEISNTKIALTTPLKSSNKNKDKKRKHNITKADISQPTNFVHVSHVGWNAQKGFDLVGSEDDEMLKPFFSKAGVSEQHLNDRDTRAFIYDFIQTNNVLASVKSETVEPPKAPPPVPVRQQNINGSQRAAPPPPPPPISKQPIPNVPINAPTARAPPPVPPPPVTTVTPAPPISAPEVSPPPPPPPPPMPAPPPMPTEIKPVTPPSEPKPDIPDTRSALLDDIRKGISLKKVDTNSSSSSRSDLLSEIQKGVQLKPAQNRELPSSNRSSDSGGAGGATDALADALRRALQERGRVIHSSEEDSDDMSDNDGEWED